ncbi:hypothetical protein MUJ63_10295 [Lachnospiraceae bacterium NSJ-143]|nr:hypothetical protein [Lachnospiraceae bacterium NSJ-143]
MPFKMRSAAADALNDYSSMEFIIANTSSEITDTRDTMCGVRSPQFDGMPRTHNSQAGEERLSKYFQIMLISLPPKFYSPLGLAWIVIG